MKIIFWQNALSIHQLPFLIHLSKSNDLTLVVDCEFNKDRISQGWHIDNNLPFEIIVTPSKQDISNLICDNLDAIHVFSGISAYKRVFFAFKKAINRRLFVVLMMEPFNKFGFYGYLRWLKYFVLSMRFRNSIRCILATGQLGVDSCRSVFLDRNNLFEWGYFPSVDVDLSLIHQSPRVKSKKILFIGELSKRKNFIPIINKIINSDLEFDCISVVGSGKLSAELLSLSKTNIKINILGCVENRDISKVILNHDILVLPSLFDGWGAVVNEALLCGTKVIVSDRCGASSLIIDKRIGSVFSLENDDFIDNIRFHLEIPQSTIERSNLAFWAHKVISHEAASAYFINIIKSVSLNSNSKCIAPWYR